MSRTTSSNSSALPRDVARGLANFCRVPTSSHDRQFFIAACVPDCVPLLHQADAEENESHGRLSAEWHMSESLSNEKVQR